MIVQCPGNVPAVFRLSGSEHIVFVRYSQGAEKVFNMFGRYFFKRLFSAFPPRNFSGLFKKLLPVRRMVFTAWLRYLTEIGSAVLCNMRKNFAEKGVAFFQKMPDRRGIRMKMVIQKMTADMSHQFPGQSKHFLRTETDFITLLFKEIFVNTFRGIGFEMRQEKLGGKAEVNCPDISAKILYLADNMMIVKNQNKVLSVQKFSEPVRGFFPCRRSLKHLCGKIGISRFPFGKGSVADKRAEISFRGVRADDRGCNRIDTVAVNLFQTAVCRDKGNLPQFILIRA